MAEHPMIDMRQVSKAFGSKQVLDGLTLSLPAGRVTCLLGPSGCGKTTLLRVAAGLLAPDSGTVTREDGRASFVFQEDRLLPWYSALANLTAFGVSESDARRALSSVLLGGEADTRVPELSGGMQRRLAIARALAFGGTMYYLDEPLRGLDTATAAPVLDAMRAALAGNTGLLITHRPEEALALADTLLLVDGPPVRIVRKAAISDFDNVEALTAWLDSR